MRLASLSEFRQLFFTPESRPSLETLRRRVDRKCIPGGRLDAGRYYVDLDEWDEANGARDNIAKQQAQLAQSPELAGLI